MSDNVSCRYFGHRWTDDGAYCRSCGHVLVPHTTPTRWDPNAGILPRLELLAKIGPGIIPAYWGYHSSRRFWYPCGPVEHQAAHRKVRLPADDAPQAALQTIWDRWQLTASQVAATIGWPDQFAADPHEAALTTGTGGSHD